MHSMTYTYARLCNPPEALSWKEIGLPPRLICYHSPPIEVGVLSAFKIKKASNIPAINRHRNTTDSFAKLNNVCNAEKLCGRQ